MVYAPNPALLAGPTHGTGFADQEASEERAPNSNMKVGFTVAKKKASVSADDSALFRKAIGDVQPLEVDRVSPVHSRPSARPRASNSAQSANPAVDAAGFSTHEAGLDDFTGESLAYVEPGLQGRVLRRLKRGQMRIEDSLDLHGMTAEEASLRLAGFLTFAVERGLRVLLVVHGKGRGSGHSGPRLKALLNRWLRQRSEVIAFCTAQPKDGGTGAVYLLLRRADVG